VPTAQIPVDFRQDQSGQLALNSGGNPPRARFDVTTTSNLPALTIDQKGTGNIIDLLGNGTTKVIVDANGNVGIGTTRPNGALNVNGQINTGSGFLPSISGNRSINLVGTDAVMSIIRYSTGGHPAIELKKYDVTGTTQESWWDMYATETDELKLRRRTGGTPGDVMIMNSLGNVGIGTATPRTIFHVNGTSAVVLPSGTMTEQPNTGINGMLRYNTDVHNLEIFASAYWRQLPSYGIPHDNLALYVDADEVSSYGGSGSTWFDIGQANNLAFTNSPTFISTKPSYFVFNGTNQYATSTLSNRAGAWSHSISIWFRLPVSQNNAVIFTIGNAQATDQQTSVQIYTSTLRWFFYSDDRDVSITFTTNVWYHLCLVYDGGLSDKRLIYINNVLQSSVAAGSIGTLNIAASANFGLGYWRTNSSSYTNCHIANFAIYNKALSKFEVAQIYSYYRKRFGY
jgi:hypothetical protein